MAKYYLLTFPNFWADVPNKCKNFLVEYARCMNRNVTYLTRINILITSLGVTFDSSDAEMDDNQKFAAWDYV